MGEIHAGARHAAHRFRSLARRRGGRPGAAVTARVEEGGGRVGVGGGREVRIIVVVREARVGGRGARGARGVADRGDADRLRAAAAEEVRRVRLGRGAASPRRGASPGRPRKGGATLFWRPCGEPSPQEARQADVFRRRRRCLMMGAVEANFSAVFKKIKTRDWLVCSSAPSSNQRPAPPVRDDCAAPARSVSCGYPSPRAPLPPPPMQRFGFLRRQGSARATPPRATPPRATPRPAAARPRRAPPRARTRARRRAPSSRRPRPRRRGHRGGSSDGGNSDDSRATTVIVKHGSRGSYGGGASGGLSGSDAFLDQWAGETAAGGGPWGDRGHAASRGGGSGGGGGGPPPPPLGTLKRVDSRTHVDEALHTIPGLRARGSIELPLTRRLAFRKCRAAPRARRAAGASRPRLTRHRPRRVRGQGRRRRPRRRRGSARRRTRGEGARVGGNWEEAYDRRHRDEALVVAGARG